MSSGLSPANHNEQYRTSYQHNLYQRGPLLYKHISHVSILPSKRPKGRLSSRPFLRLTRCLLPLHYSRHCTHMNFTAVLGMDGLQHGLSGQRREFECFVKVLDPLCVSAGLAMRHIYSYSLHDVF